MCRSNVSYGQLKCKAFMWANHTRFFWDYLECTLAIIWIKNYGICYFTGSICKVSEMEKIMQMNCSEWNLITALHMTTKAAAWCNYHFIKISNIVLKFLMLPFYLPCQQWNLWKWLGTHIHETATIPDGTQVAHKCILSVSFFNTQCTLFYTS